MSDDELGPQPPPTAEEPEKFPGGADALEDEEKYGDRGNGSTGPAPRDLDPDKNPASPDEAPEVQQQDDKQQEPDDPTTLDKEAGSSDDAPEAGQEDEEGNPEEPA